MSKTQSQPLQIQPTLDALRAVRMSLYAVPGATVSAMSTADQIKYGDDLQKLSSAIMKLETLQLQQVNAQFKAKAGALQTASVKLQHDTAALTDAVQIIGTINSGIGLITNIVKLLG